MSTFWTVYVVAAGLAVAGGGLYLLWRTIDKAALPFLSLRDIARNWRALLSHTPSGCGFLSSDELGYALAVPHHQGWYWTAGGPEAGAAGRVHVTPDSVARLPYPDRWHDGRRLLDSSAFCLRVKGTSQVVEYLSRGGRFQLEFTDGLIRSQDGHVCNGLLAVHFAVPHRLDRAGLLEQLFDARGQLVPLLHSGVTGLLQQEIGRRPYRQVMYDARAILDRLNGAWAADALFADFRPLLDVAFTALLVRPREEAELAQLQKLEAHRVRILDELKENILQVEREAGRWGHQWDDVLKVQNAAMGELRLHVPSTIQHAADGLADLLANMQDPTHLIAAVEKMLVTGRTDLRLKGAAVVRAFTQLEDFMAKLRTARAAMAERFKELRG
jgi:hypothetical protein